MENIVRKEEALSMNVEGEKKEIDYRSLSDICKISEKCQFAKYDLGTFGHQNLFVVHLWNVVIHRIVNSCKMYETYESENVDYKCLM